MTQTQIISIINQKGGVGKTTTVINLAAGLALQNKKILVVDLDPQGNATTGLGLSNSEDSDKTIYTVLNGTRIISDVLKKTQFENLDLISSNVDLSGLEVETAGDSKRAFILKDQIMAYLKDSSSIYDYILIDCPPSLSVLTVNALIAADSLIIPLQSEFYALEGLSQLLLSVREIRSSGNPDLRIDGVVLTMFDSRNGLSLQVEDDARKNLGQLVFKTVIPRNVRVSEAPSFSMPVLSYDTKSKGAAAYRALAEELLLRPK